MGCDIHVYIEYRHEGCPWQADPNHVITKEDDGGEWINEVSAGGRCYELFARIAGVRGSYGDSLEPRGTPDDTSPTIKKAIELWGCDGHSHSWITLDEFRTVLRKMRIPIGKSDEAFYDWHEIEKRPVEEWPGWGAIVKYCKRLKKEQEQIDALILGKKAKGNVQVRLVFFFDN